MNALVISGGGSKGAFAGGVCDDACDLRSIVYRGGKALLAYARGVNWSVQKAKTCGVKGAFFGRYLLENAPFAPQVRIQLGIKTVSN